MKLNMDLKKYIRSIKDYPKKGILFRDITTLIKEPKAFNFAIDKIIEISKKIEFDKVSAIESRGFIFASTVSYLTNKPLILLRKKNKLPAARFSVDFQLEYGEATIEVHKDSIENNEKILVIDDLVATGGTAEAAAKLIEVSGGTVAGFIFIINLFDLPGNNLLKSKSYFTESLVEFPGH
jgi:adenine phosphoribosyltransferase|tara:strand:+ start:1363 stop:1902 length:540 start_codon:yes stop_codon:yes gene_type:complete